MKKVVLLVLSLVLAMACVVSSFAYAGIVTFDEDSCKGILEGKTLNSGDSAELTSGVLKIRQAWTASRAMPNDTARFVDLGDGNIGVKIVNTEYITNDPDSNPRLENDEIRKAYVTADLKVVNPGTFCGIVIDCDPEVGFNSPGNNDFEATHEKYILYTGYGFTIKDANTIVAFVNASATGTVDAVEIALGFDASAAFHTYALYRDADAKKSYLCADDACIAVFDFSGADDKVGIYSADGANMIVNTNNYWNNGNIWFAVVGASEVYLDNIGYDVYETVPAPKAAPAEPADVGFVNASWDNFKINGETNLGNGDGNASTKVAPIDGTNGDVKVIEFNGWAGFKQDIKAVGYSIDGKAVFDENSKFFDNSGDDKNAVQDPEKGGDKFAHRFQVKANVEGLNGEHKIAVVIKLADDTIVTLDSAFDALVHGHATASANTTMTYNGPKAAAPEQKPTGDVAVVFAVVAVAAMAVVVLKKRETI